jgi:hypothetical protein
MTSINAIEIIEVSLTDRLLEKFSGAPITGLTYAQALSERHAIMNLVMARLGHATVDQARAINVCDMVISQLKAHFDFVPEG